MKRGSRLLLFLVVVIVILIAATFFVLSRGGNILGRVGATPTPPSVNIYFVGQPINQDDLITVEVLFTREMQQDQVTDKMITSPQQVVGKYAAYPLAQGMMLTTDLISDRPGLNLPGSEAARVISPGMVAISMPISRLNSVAYGIQAGDHVDVIATTAFLDVDATFQSRLPNLTAKVSGTGFLPDTLPQLAAGISSGGAGSEQGRAELDPTLNQALYLQPSEPQRPRLVSQMILQDIQVLHVGDFLLPEQANAPTPEPGQPDATPTPVVLPEVVTLIVRPQDAVALTYLLASGTNFTLALRAPDDTTRVETEAATLQYLLSQYAIPVPAKLPFVMDVSSLGAPTPAP